MDLEFKIKDSAAKPKVVRVAFNPPLAGYEEVKPRLLGMKADADEALGTVRDPVLSPRRVLTMYVCLGGLILQVKAPQITHFEVPFQIWTTGSLLLFLIYTTSVPEHTTSHFWWLARTLRYHVFPAALFTAVWAFVGVVHASEGVYAATLARKHHMPWHIAVRVHPFRSAQFHFPLFFFENSLRLSLTWDSRRWPGSASPRFSVSLC